MRLIDAYNLNKLIKEYMKDYKNSVTRLTACRAILSMLGDKNQTPTIDPETLPIVQELREQLKKVTEERDKVINELTGCCYHCMYYTSRLRGISTICLNCKTNENGKKTNFQLKVLQEVKNDGMD